MVICFLFSLHFPLSTSPYHHLPWIGLRFLRRMACEDHGDTKITKQRVVDNILKSSIPFGSTTKAKSNFPCVFTAISKWRDLEQGATTFAGSVPVYVSLEGREREL